MRAADHSGLLPSGIRSPVLSLYITGLAQPLAEGSHKRCIWAGRCAAEEPDHRHRLLLRADDRRRSHCAGEYNYEIAASHAQPLALIASKDYGSTGPLSKGWTNARSPPFAEIQTETSPDTRGVANLKFAVLSWYGAAQLSDSHNNRLLYLFKTDYYEWE